MIGRVRLRGRYRDRNPLGSADTDTDFEPDADGLRAMMRIAAKKGFASEAPTQAQALRKRSGYGDPRRVAPAASRSMAASARGAPRRAGGGPHGRRKGKTSSASASSSASSSASAASEIARASAGGETGLRRRRRNGVTHA